MRTTRTLLAPLLVLVACGHPPQLLPETLDLPPYCASKAKLATPPHGDKTIEQVIAFARSAARTANAAIDERDKCAMNYAQLRARVFDVSRVHYPATAPPGRERPGNSARLSSTWGLIAALPIASANLLHALVADAEGMTDRPYGTA